jgi:hypothetical protein
LRKELEESKQSHEQELTKVAEANMKMLRNTEEIEGRFRESLQLIRRLEDEKCSLLEKSQNHHSNVSHQQLHRSDAQPKLSQSMNEDMQTSKLPPFHPLANPSTHSQPPKHTPIFAGLSAIKSPSEQHLGSNQVQQGAHSLLQ